MSLLPFSTSTTPEPPAAAEPLQPGGSSPSNSWFTSPWMSEGRGAPSLLETVNLWLMVAVAVAISEGSSRHWSDGQARMKLPLFSCFTSPRSQATLFTTNLAFLDKQTLFVWVYWTCDAEPTISSTGV